MKALENDQMEVEIPKPAGRMSLSESDSMELSSSFTNSVTISDDEKKHKRVKRLQRSPTNLLGFSPRSQDAFDLGVKNGKKRTNVGQTPLAMRMAHDALIAGVVDPSILEEKPCMSPLAMNVVLPEELSPSQPLRWTSVDPTPKTGLVYLPYCLKHLTGRHQECPARLEVLCEADGGLNCPFFSKCLRFPPASIKAASLSDLLRVHDGPYLRHVQSICEALPEGGEASGKLDNDTILCRDSFSIAVHAAGACIHAVKAVMSGQCKRCFVAIRPPGHHAGPHGCAPCADWTERPDMVSSGFCLVNNVAVAAAFARAQYNLRIACVDFDIHHGNGTEAIFRNLAPHKQKLPLPSSWAPQFVESFKPWSAMEKEDPDNALFASIHVCRGTDFFPGGGTKKERCDRPKIVNFPLEWIGPVQAKSRWKLTIPQKERLHAQASRAFKEAVRQVVAELDRFKPDLLLLSAGFDGHMEDAYYFLDESDYVSLTHQMCDVADRHCKGRIVSVLEGGYHIFKRGASRKRQHGTRSKTPAKYSPPTSDPSLESWSFTLQAAPDSPCSDMGAGKETFLVDRGSESALARSVAAHVATLMRTCEDEE